MAENKNSFLIYSEWLENFEALDDVNAGKLVKHLFRYVNDKDPSPENKLVEISFIPMKQVLKRNLKSWEKERLLKSDGGVIGNLKRWHPDLYEKYLADKTKLKELLIIASSRKASHTDKNIAVNVSVNDSVNVSDNVNDKNKYKSILLSELNSDDYEIVSNLHLEVAISFQKLFIKNQSDAGIKNSSLKKAKGTWVDDIRFMFEIDKRTKEEFRKVWDFLSKDVFWKSNILSTKKLREKFESLLIRANNEKQTTNNQSKIANLSDGVTD